MLIRYFLFLFIFMFTGLLNCQNNIKTSQSENKTDLLLGNWSLKIISNNEQFVPSFMITGFNYYKHENDSNNSKKSINWQWGEERESDNGDRYPITVTCPFDTLNNFILVPFDSILTRRSGFTIFNDTIYVQKMQADGNEVSEPIDNINSIRFYNIHSDNCLGINIDLLLLLERKQIYLFSKYGMSVLEKTEH